jgi:hypothetical protein
MLHGYTILTKMRCFKDKSILFWQVKIIYLPIPNLYYTFVPYCNLFYHEFVHWKPELEHY